MDASPTTAFLKRRAPLAAAIVVVGGVLLGAYQLVKNSPFVADKESAPQTKRRLVAKVTTAVLEQSFDRSVSFVGRIEAARESELSFERVGLVTELVVDEGDDIQAGAVLGQLDTTKLDAQRNVLVARMAAANALLKELIAGPRDEELKAQRAEVQRLRYELKRIELSRDRIEELLKRSAASRDRYEADLYSAESTKAALGAATAELEELENGTREEKIEAQRAVVREIEAEIASVDVDLAKSKLLAPFSGSIGDRLVDEGNVVSVGQPIVSLLEVGRPELRVGVDPKTAASLKVGELIPIVTAKQAANGTIKAIRRDVSGRTRTVDVLISLPTQEMGKGFRSGELATAKVTKLVPAAGLWLPMGALTEGTRGLWSVFVAAQRDDHHVIQRRDIEVLHTETDRVFVRGAVAEGEPVVVSGVHRLVPGLQVQVEQAAGRWE